MVATQFTPPPLLAQALPASKIYNTYGLYLRNIIISLRHLVPRICSREMREQGVRGCMGKGGRTSRVTSAWGVTVPVLPYPGSLLLVQAWRRGEGDVKLSKVGVGNIADNGTVSLPQTAPAWGGLLFLPKEIV